jgi:hypothetical protein
MKSMREMMSLMEGVVAIPGIGEGFKGAVAGGVVGGAATKSVGGAMTGAKIGSKVQDALVDEGANKPKRYEVPAYQRKEKGEKPLTPKDIEDQDREGNISDRENLKKAAEKLKEKSTSEKQARFMAACAHGADYDSCPPDKVSKEFNKADKGTKQLSNAMKESHVSDGQMSNPGVAREILAMENDMVDIGFEESNGENANITQATRMFKDYTDSFVEPQEALDLVMRHFDEQGLEAAIMIQFGGPSDDEPSGPDDLSADADALGSAGMGTDEYYGSDADFGADYMEEDLQNGYDDIHYADGQDYFPNGADGPVVKDVGPSGARQGDNPEQKYISFLGEAAKKKIN